MTWGLVSTRPAPPLDEIPPFRSRSLSEDVLVRAYSSAAEPRVEPCACGEVIVLEPGDSLPLVVAVHVAGPSHAAWSAATRLVP